MILNPFTSTVYVDVSIAQSIGFCYRHSDDYVPLIEAQLVFSASDGVF